MANENVKPLTRAESVGVKLYLGISFAVVLLMMLAGLVMRASQSEWMVVPDTLFYQLLTVHGAGMVGIAGFAGAAVMWFFLRRYVDLSVQILYANLAFFLVGVVAILVSIFVGGYAGGWTFLWPLPANSMGVWSAHAAAGFIVGLTLIGVGFLLFYLDAGLAITRRFGSILKGLGVDQLFGKVNPSHPATVVASSMVVIVNTLGILVGAIVLVVTLVNLYVPSLSINALLAKNMIYFFGHVFINAAIYMAVIAVYELLPLYAKRPWKVSKAFYASWLAVTLFVLAVYPHHLLMDGVMPKSLLALGQVVSYLSGIPVLLVTTYGALILVYKSNIEWQAPARWLMLALLGWSVGVVPAIVDGTIVVNRVMHNTLWVPGHFHLYLLAGFLPMIIGFALHVFAGKRGLNEAFHRRVFNVYALGSLAFGAAFLASGAASVPRRWATHWEAWLAYDRVSTVIAAVVVLAATLVVVSVLGRLITGGAPAVHASER